MSAFSNSNFSTSSDLVGAHPISMAHGNSGFTKPEPELTCFQSYFTDCMDMYADAQTVANYFDEHSVWFRRCAEPMRAEPIGQNSYALVIGKFGSFGYELEPKVGLDLLPQADRVYRIETVAIPNYETVGYDIDFRAAMELVEGPGVNSGANSGASSGESAGIGSATCLTHVQWQLDLAVKLQFPRFIQALPQNLIASTGDRILRQVVKQVSKRLMRKVQDDFHSTHGIPFAGLKQ